MIEDREKLEGVDAWIADAQKLCASLPTDRALTPSERRDFISRLCATSIELYKRCGGPVQAVDGLFDLILSVADVDAGMPAALFQPDEDKRIQHRSTRSGETLWKAIASDLIRYGRSAQRLTLEQAAESLARNIARESKGSVPSISKLKTRLTSIYKEATKDGAKQPRIASVPIDDAETAQRLSSYLGRNLHFLQSSPRRR